MRSTSLRRRARAAVAGPAVGLVLLLWPAVALAHAELETAIPADGAVLEAPPTEIVFTYTEELDPSGSSLTLHDASGTQLAAGGVDPSDDLVMRIDPPELVAGEYEIRSTALSAHDDHLERNVVTFTVSEPAPTPTSTPSLTPAPSATATLSISPTASPLAAPSPSPSADGTPTSGTEVLIPIVAAVVLVALLGAWLFGRSRGRGPA